MRPTRWRRSTYWIVGVSVLLLVVVVVAAAALVAARQPSEQVAVERGHGGGVDDHAALAVSARFVVLHAVGRGQDRDDDGHQIGDEGVGVHRDPMLASHSSPRIW